jgi:hypothetical protein
MFEAYGISTWECNNVQISEIDISNRGQFFHLQFHEQESKMEYMCSYLVK